MKWPHKRLAELGIVSTGSTPKTSEPRFYGGEVPFITPSDLDAESPVKNTPRTLTNEGAAEARIIPEGSVMVCCIGSLGKIGIAGCSVATNQQINSVSFDRSLVWPAFGFYACRLLKPKMECIAPATTLPIISKSKFSKLTIPVPPLAEQRRIAEVLDRAEALRAKRRAALAQLDALTQSLFLDLFGDPVPNPKGWPTSSLAELGQIHTGKTPPTKLPDMFGGEIPFATPGDLDGRLSRTERTLTSAGAEYVRVVRAGSALVGCIGNIGKMAKTPVRCAFNQQINAVEWNGRVHDDYGIAALAFAIPQMMALSSSTVVPILNKSGFMKVELRVPPIPLQREFARRVTAVESLKTAQRASLAELDALFATLQHRAFRGEL